MPAKGGTDGVPLFFCDNFFKSSMLTFKFHQLNNFFLFLFAVSLLLKIFNLNFTLLSLSLIFPFGFHRNYFKHSITHALQSQRETSNCFWNYEYGAWNSDQDYQKPSCVRWLPQCYHIYFQDCQTRNYSERWRPFPFFPG